MVVVVVIALVVIVLRIGVAVVVKVSTSSSTITSITTITIIIINTTTNRDLAWAEAPYKRHFNRKLRKMVYTSQVTEIIKKLGDNSSGFHPKALWEQEKDKEEKAKEDALAQSIANSETSKKDKNKKEKEVVKKGADKIKEDNAEKMRVDAILAEINRIRNCKKFNTINKRNEDTRGSYRSSY